MDFGTRPLRIFPDLTKAVEHIRNCVLEEIIDNIRDDEEPTKIDGTWIWETIRHELEVNWEAWPVLPDGDIKDAIIEAETKEIFAAFMKDKS